MSEKRLNTTTVATCTAVAVAVQLLITLKDACKLQD